jgi:GTP cyclohydrolase IB
MQEAENSKKPTLPDVASQSPDFLQTGALDRVGMRGIEIPVTIEDGQGSLMRVPGHANAFVSLQSPETRGIHMSRLFKIAQDELAGSPLGFSLLQKILFQFLESHKDMSDFAGFSVDFSAMVQRKALKSENSGWRTYPIKVSAEQTRGKSTQFFIEVLVTYSSTCPASAALARQLIQENFKNTFSEEVISKEEVSLWLGSQDGVLATPHAQRSYARVKVELPLQTAWTYLDLIDLLEEVLQTPVQAVVKREDEQEFALRNGQNLMFCEDAARRVQKAFEQTKDVLDYLAEFRHVESLHPHDAVATVSKRQTLHF